MQPGKDDGRRSARAKALARQLEENPRVLYADASLRKYDDRATAVATSVDKLIVSASLRTTDPAIAEEVAVALALVQPSVDTVVTDSKQQQTILRRTQAGSLAHPVLLHRMYPAEHDTLCPFCKTERGTLARIIAECKELKNPPPPLPPNTPNSQPPERWETWLSSPALPTQLALTARGQELLETYGSRE
ncbi:hypothetical protein HPB50_019891 [Hyalomma asiaticum]|uniref:Uncharacterized protein n=1 Tax=Hyalomma asiaticum TaxID=266040 RepID=A0ACB7RJ11_HYAAI|nr:hypothetical protein HPB50_019891 [Hyalomma asiaticum]